MVSGLTWQCSQISLCRYSRIGRADSLDSQSYIRKHLPLKQEYSSSTSNSGPGGRQRRSLQHIDYYKLHSTDICSYLKIELVSRRDPKRDRCNTLCVLSEAVFALEQYSIVSAATDDEPSKRATTPRRATLRRAIASMLATIPSPWPYHFKVVLYVFSQGIASCDQYR